VVNSLKSEFSNQIKFAMADITTEQGRAFAATQKSSNVTLLFFRPDGKRIAKITGVHDKAFFRKAFKGAFRLK